MALMKTPPPKSIDGKIVIRTHDRKTFANCIQQWHWNSPLQRNLEHRMPQKALWFGTGGHDSLAAYYHPEKKQNPVEFWQNWCHTERAKINKLTEFGLDWDWEKEYAELVELGAEVLSHYMSWAPTGDGNYGDDMYKIVGVEMEFEVPVRDLEGRPTHAVDSRGNVCPVVYQGRVDAMLRDLRYGRLWMFEHKFYHPNQFSQGSQEDHLMMDEQCTSYAWGIQEQLKISAIQEQLAEPIEGILFNMVKKKAPTKADILANGSLGQRANIDSTWPYYRQQLVDHYGAAGMAVPWQMYTKMADILKAKSGLQNPFFRRVAVRRNPMELTAAAQRIWAQSLRMTSGGEYIYPTPDAMKCKFCSFRSACLATMDNSDPEYILTNKFREREDSRAKGQSTASDDVWGWS